MANTNLTLDSVYKDAVRVFRNNTVFVNSIGAQYDNSFSAHGASEGEAIRIQVPQEHSVGTGKTIVTVDREEKAVTLTRSVWRHVAVKASSSEISQDGVELFKQNVVAPAIATLAGYVDNYCLNQVCTEVAQCVPLPVTSLDRADVLAAGVALDNGLAPRDGMRTILLNPQGHSDIVTDSSGLFNAAPNVSQQYKDGIVSIPSFGMNFGMSQNMPTFTTGSRNTAYVITSSPPVSGATTVDVQTGSGTIVVGDSFTMAGVYEANAIHKGSTGKLKRFVATAASAGGTVTISFLPAIISTGPFQNVTALPAAAAAITFMGAASTAYPQGLAYHKNAFAIGFCDLDKPRDAAYIKSEVIDNIPIRMWMFSDGRNSDSIIRFDVLFGVKTVIDRSAVRLFGF